MIIVKAARFVIGKSGNNPMFADSIWYSHTIECYLSMKVYGLQLHKQQGWISNRIDHGCCPDPFPRPALHPSAPVLVANGLQLSRSGGPWRKGYPGTHGPKTFYDMLSQYLIGTNTVVLSMLQSSAGDQAEEESSSLVSSYPCPASFTLFLPRARAPQTTYTWVPVLAFAREQSDLRLTAKLERKTQTGTCIMIHT